MFYFYLVLSVALVPILNNFFEIIYRINPKLIGDKIPSQGLYL
jgi:hypothetical protein